MGVRFCKNNFFEGKWLKREVFVQFILIFNGNNHVCVQNHQGKYKYCGFHYQFQGVCLSWGVCFLGFFFQGCRVYGYLMGVRFFYSHILQGVRLFDGVRLLDPR